MNFSLITGLILALLIFFGTIATSLANVAGALNSHALLIVVGGTFAASLVGLPFKELSQSLNEVWARLRNIQIISDLDIISELGSLSKSYQMGAKKYQEHCKQIKDEFLRDVGTSFFKVRNEVSKEKLESFFAQRVQTEYDKKMETARIVKTLSKFPPAFGLMGTTIGLIAVLQNLGLESSDHSKMGPALAVALVTTLYGLGIANFILIPLAENLAVTAKKELNSRMMIIEGMMLIYENTPSAFITEHLKSYINLDDRNKLFRK